MRLYSGIFFDNGLHITYHFDPPHPYLPTEVNEGDEVTVDIIGIVLKKEFGVAQCRVGYKWFYDVDVDEDGPFKVIELDSSISTPCQCLSCDPDGTRYICSCEEPEEDNSVSHKYLRHQKDSDVPLHMTLYTDKNTRPVETGRYLKKYPEEILEMYGYATLIGKWGYFDK